MATPLSSFASRKGLAASRSARTLLLSVAMWMLWIVVSLLMSLPSTIYNMAKAVPGFLGLSSHRHVLGVTLVWVLSATVALTHQLFMSFLAPLLAKELRRRQPEKVSTVALLSWVQLLSGWLVPALVIAIFHPRCKQGWTLLWNPCRTHRLGASHKIHFAGSVFDRFSDPFDFLRTEDFCSPLQTYAFSSRCFSAVIADSVHLLTKSAVQSSFVVPILLVLRGRSIHCTRAAVTVWSLWEILLVFGICSPTLLPLLAATAFSHSRILFMKPYTLLDQDEEVEEKLGLPVSAQVCTFIAASAVIACLIQIDKWAKWTLMVAVWAAALPSMSKMR